MADNNKVAKLLKQKEALEARIKKAQQIEKTAERKKDTRRKILLGSVLMKLMSADESYRDSITKMLSKELTRKADRELFDLPPLEAGIDHEA